MAERYPLETAMLLMVRPEESTSSYLLVISEALMVKPEASSEVEPRVKA